MRTAPGRSRPKSKGLSQAAAPDGPLDVPLLPVPDAGAAGTWAGTGEGSAVRGCSDAGTARSDTAGCRMEVLARTAAPAVTRLALPSAVPLVGDTSAAGSGPGAVSSATVAACKSAAWDAAGAGASTAGRSVCTGSVAEAGSGTAPVKMSETGWSAGSSTGTASVAGTTTICTAPAVTASATSTRGAVTTETIPDGTAWFTTGTAAMRLSASPETCVSEGCTSPGAAAGPAGEPVGESETVSARSWVNEEIEPVTLPRSDEESGAVSADAAAGESVSHATAAAPARSAGRRARHGELIRAMRTTPQ